MQAGYIFFCCVVFVLTPSTPLVQAQTTNDAYWTPVDEPLCVPVTNNDDAGTVISSVSNAKNGTTNLNYPSFWYANSNNSIIIEVENYQLLNWGNVSDSSYVNSTTIWAYATNTSASQGGLMVATPELGASAGNSNYGNSLGYNVMFRNTGNVKTAARLFATDINSNSAHYLYQPDATSSNISFVTSGTTGGFNSITTYSVWNWDTTGATITITKKAPVLSRFYLAIREDGIRLDQFYFAPSTYFSVSGTTAKNASRFVNCSSNEILYFPASGFTGTDNFTYVGTNGNSSSNSTVTIYVGGTNPIPSPSRTPTPSVTPTITPSKTPTPSITPSKTPSPSVTPSATPSESPSPSVTPTPSVTPSVTPSPSSSPSANSSPSTSPSITPTPSVTPSASPTSSQTPSHTPSSTATPTSSVTPTASTSVSASPTASITPSTTPSTSSIPSPSPMPVMCDSMPASSSSTNYHTLTPNNETANFGQTFKPFASGSLISFSFLRASTDSGTLQGTAYLLQNFVGNPESGYTYRSFPFTMTGAGWQVFNFTPPMTVDTIRYEFLLASLGGGSSASMMISDLPLASQYIIRDEEITPSVSAAFQYCMLPDYYPSPSVSPSTSATSSPTPSSHSSSDSKANSNMVVVAAAVAGGGFVLLSAIAGIVIFTKSRRNKKKEELATDVELHDGSSPTEYSSGINLTSSNYNPIPANMQTIPEYAIIPADDEWRIPYKELTLTKEVGRGAFGKVYQGMWKNTPVAVKQAIKVSNHFQQEEFFAEAEVMKKLTPHPNVTRLLGICSKPVCMVLEFVDNGSLSAWLASKNTLDDETKVSIAHGIAAGMLHLHKAGIIHRDLAARNILLTKEMVPKVSDFGMSRQTLEDQTNKTASDIGPIRWMAPEAMKQKVYSQKTDAWSFGVVLYEILTRKLPYQNLDLVHVATNVIMRELSLVPEIEKDAEVKKYPVILVKALQQCLSFEPQERPDFETIVATLETK